MLVAFLVEDLVERINVRELLLDSFLAFPFKALEILEVFLEEVDRFARVV